MRLPLSIIVPVAAAAVTACTLLAHEPQRGEAAAHAATKSSVDRLPVARGSGSVSSRPSSIRRTRPFFICRSTQPCGMRAVRSLLAVAFSISAAPSVGGAGPIGACEGALGLPVVQP